MAKPKNKKKTKTQEVKTKGGDLNAWIDKRFSQLSLLCLGLSAIFSLILFDLKIGVGGDDSAYIKRAFDLVHEGRFPSFQGPLYPMLLSVFVGIFGINMPVLKFLSFGFMLTGIFFFLKAYHRRVESAILLLTGLMVSVNSMLLFYASQTYVEAFFFMLLSINVYLFFQFFDTDHDSFISNINWKGFVGFGFSLFLLGLTKTIGFAFVIGTVAFLLFTRKFKQSAGVLAVFAGFNLFWYGVKRLIWDFDALQFSDQASTLLLKNPYVPSEGKEEFMGFVQRFTDNLGIYLSKHFFAFFNLRDITDQASLSFLIVALLLIAVAFISVVRRNRYLLFTAFTMLSMLLVSFVVLQQIWDTPRLIVPFVPFLTLFIFAGLYNSPWDKAKNSSKKIVPVLMVLLLFTTLGKTMTESKKERTGLQTYFAGNKLKGYTPDWVNFIKMSEWAAKNTPDSVMIASRKPSISFLYTGRKFHGIYRIPMHEEEAYFQELKQKNTRFVVLDEMKFQQLNLPMQIQLPWKRYISGFYAGSLGNKDNSKSVFYAIYEIKDAQAEQLLDTLKQSGVEFEDAESLLQTLEPYKSTMMIIKPDELYDELRSRNARYVIMANLRKYETRKTPFTINTIRRYMFYVQHKYPGLLRQVSEVGIDEKAYLFEVQFEKFETADR